MNETDAGDYAIGQSHPVAAAAVLERPKQPTQTFSAPLKLQPFLLLFKNAKGAAAADLIVKSTAAPGVYVFGELLQLPALQALQSQPQFANQINLINLFAYGIWTDYTANPTTFPTLTKQQETKLKQLTIITLARENRIIPYSILLNSLDIATVPALEDLIIEAFYGGLMSGKMDQRAKRLEVISCIGRDVQPNPSSISTPITASSISAPPAAADVAQSMDLDNTASSSTLPTPVAPVVPRERLPQGSAHTLSSLTSSLKDWQDTISTLLHSLDFHIAQISTNAINQLSIDTIYTEEVQKTLADVSKSSTSAGKSVEKSSAEKSGGEFFRIGGTGGGSGSGGGGVMEASPGMGSASSAVPSSAFGNFPASASTSASIEEEGEEMEIDPVGKGTYTRKTKRGRI